MGGSAGPGRAGYTPSFARAPFVFAVTEASVLPGPVLVDLMSDLQASPAANKALLHRMVVADVLTVTRVGRVGCYRMGPAMLAGFALVRGDAPPAPWDGRFHALVYDIPESRRRDRDRFLAAASRAGYRLLRRGVLIAPDDLSRTLAGTRPDEVTRCWLTFDPADVPRLVRRCWELDRFRPGHEAEVARLEALVATDLEALDGPAAFETLFGAVAARAALVLRTGELPPELVGASWPGQRLVTLVAEVDARLRVAARRHAAAVVAASPYAHLVAPADPAGATRT